VLTNNMVEIDLGKQCQLSCSLGVDVGVVNNNPNPMPPATNPRSLSPH
jgi:hypothetical protein